MLCVAYPFSLSVLLVSSVLLLCTMCMWIVCKLHGLLMFCFVSATLNLMYVFLCSQGTLLFFIPTAFEFDSALFIVLMCNRLLARPSACLLS